MQYTCTPAGMHTHTYTYTLIHTYTLTMGFGLYLYVFGSYKSSEYNAHHQPYHVIFSFLFIFPTHVLS